MEMNNDVFNIDQGLTVKKTLSEAQIRANRKNSVKSTGPKDTSKTRFNAVKHSLLSEKAWKVMTDEEKEATESVRQEITEHFKRPLTFIDTILIDKFLIAWWRSRKAHEMHAIYMKKAEHDQIRDDFDENNVHDLLQPKIPDHLKDGLEKEDLISSQIGEKIELMLRYVTSADKEFYRAFDALEKRINMK